MLLLFFYIYVIICIYLLFLYDERNQCLWLPFVHFNKVWPAKRKLIFFNGNHVYSCVRSWYYYYLIFFRSVGEFDRDLMTFLSMSFQCIVLKGNKVAWVHSSHQPVQLNCSHKLLLHLHNILFILTKHF